MKQLSVFGTTIWIGALTLLALAAFWMFWGFIAAGIYGVVQELGFSDKATYWSYSLVLLAMILLAGILWQLSKLANKR